LIERCLLQQGVIEMPMRPKTLHACVVAWKFGPKGWQMQEIPGAEFTLPADLVLIAMGGIAFRLPLECWPRISGVRWVVPSSWQARHSDAVELESLDMDFTDVLASCDALLTKPGYGSFAEAACNGAPVLYLDRKDWPEAPYLVEWLKRQGRCMEVERAALERGAIAAPLEALWALPPATPVEPEGIAQAADLLQDLLS